MPTIDLTRPADLRARIDDVAGRREDAGVSRTALLLDVGVPISSLAWTSPSRLASVQHGAPAVVLQAPLDWFGAPGQRRLREQAAERVGQRDLRVEVVRPAGCTDVLPLPSRS